MSAEWYLARGGQQRVGPLTSQQLKQMAASGQITSNDLVWKDGMAQWVPASQVKGLVGGGSGPSPAFTNAPAPQPETAASEPEPASVVAAYEEDAGPAPSGEPWFYGFLDRFAKVFMWLGLSLVILLVIYGLIQAVSMLSMSPLVGIILLIATFIMAGIYALAILLWTAMTLLLVDAGRNLRSINRKVGKSE
jgi:hypothetical protein